MMTKPSAAACFAEPSGTRTAMGVFGPCALVAGLVFAPAVQAQQPQMTTVTLITQDKGMVDAKPMAAKDIVAYVSAQHAARSGLRMISLETCPKVACRRGPKHDAGFAEEQIYGRA